MELAPRGVELSFEVTFDRPDLNVAMSVYDDSGDDPVLIQGPSAMAIVVGNTYRAKFTPNSSKPYIIFKAVYTDDTFETLSEDYSQGSESIIAQTLDSSSTSNSTGCSIVGVVEVTRDVIGVVQC